MNSLHEKNAAKSIKKRVLKDSEWLRVSGLRFGFRAMLERVKDRGTAGGRMASQDGDKVFSERSSAAVTLRTIVTPIF